MTEPSDQPLDQTDSAETKPLTVAELLRARADDDAPGLLFEDRSWTWRQVVVESEQRAARALPLRRPGPFHIGVLLDNVPDYLFWLGGAALAGATVVGINPTRRGQELARDIRFADCQLVVTDAEGAALLDGLDLGIAPDRLLLVDTLAADRNTAATGSGDQGGEATTAEPMVSPADLYLLLFTSGTTGSPKAVKCSQGRLAAIAWRAAAGYGFQRDDICYCPMPLFHGNAIMALWAPATSVGATVALTRRFTASGFLADVRRHRATRFTYVGKALAYVLATPEDPSDADNTLRQGFGTEASTPDRAAFEARFGCRLVEGYGSSEGGAVITVTPATPPGSLGLPNPGDDIAVCSPLTMAECPPARFDDAGRLLNADEAIGEIVNRGRAANFEGYYKNADGDAERVHAGWYWTGDLAYRDQAGFFYFAGRGDDWLRVDSENFAAAPVERIIERHPDLAAVAVYAVADPRSGDAVMAALELRPDTPFDPDRFAAFLADQPDMGTKWSPRFVRVMDALPLTATGKITKAALRRTSWLCDDPVFWAPDRQLSRYRRLTGEDRSRLAEELTTTAGPPSYLTGQCQVSALLPTVRSEESSDFRAGHQKGTCTMSVMKRLSGIVQAKANKALDKAENPADMLDLSYEKQQENLQKVRRALADVATAKKRLELQATELQGQATKLQDQAKQALSQGQEDLAREALTRRAALADQLTDLGTQHSQVEAQQQQLESTATRLSTQIAAFRTKKETLKASYTASKAQASIGEAVSGISESMTDAGMTLDRAQDKISQMQARAGAIDELIGSGALPDALGGGKDDIQSQLDATSQAGQVDSELAALKAQLGTAAPTGGALPSAPDAPADPAAPAGGPS